MNFAAYLTSFEIPKRKYDLSSCKTPEAMDKWRKTTRNKRNARWKAAFDGAPKNAQQLRETLGIKHVETVNLMLREMKEDGLVRKCGEEPTGYKNKVRYLWEWIE